MMKKLVLFLVMVLSLVPFVIGETPVHVVNATIDYTGSFEFDFFIGVWRIVANDQ